MDDWKAFFNPRLVLIYPVRTLGMLCAVFGVFHAPFDLNNRYLAFGFLLLCLSYGVGALRNIYRPGVGRVGQRTPYIFSFIELLRSLVFWPLAAVFVLLCLHQAGLTPRLNAYLTNWTRTHSL